MRTFITILFCLSFIINLRSQTNYFPPNGDVGIGIQNPGSALGIFRSTEDAKLSLTTDYTPGNSSISFRINQTGRDGAIIYQNNGRLSFNLDNIYCSYVETNEYMTIHPNGNVGIGDQNPSCPLSIYRESKDAKISLTTDYTSGSNSIWFRINQTGRDGAIIYQNDGRLSFNLDKPYSSYVESNEYLTILPNGNVGIDNITPDYKLDVGGTIRACEIKVDLASGECPDYVFSSEYNLRSLESLKEFVNENSHLPEVKPAILMESEGMDLKEMNVLLLKKMEEMTLYMIDINEQLQQVKKENKHLPEIAPAADMQAMVPT